MILKSLAPSTDSSFADIYANGGGLDASRKETFKVPSSIGLKC